MIYIQYQLPIDFLITVNNNSLIKSVKSWFSNKIKIKSNITLSSSWLIQVNILNICSKIDG